jgi:acetylglutamate kinase
MTSATVVKLGGSTLGQHDTSLADLASLHAKGRSLVVVHGGGPIISEWLGKHGVRSRFVRGLRVTDAEALEVVVAVLAGLVNKQTVSALQARGAAAIGMSGVDGRTLIAEQLDAELGFVGKIVEVHPDAVQAVIEAGRIAVVAPLAIERGTSQILNVNADTAAGQLAVVLGAERLVFLTDVPGVLDEAGGMLERLTARDARDLLDRSTIAGGMIPKVEAALQATESGISTVITDGRCAGALRDAMGTGAGGTTVVGA